jgi:hypothetical protein
MEKEHGHHLFGYRNNFYKMKNKIFFNRIIFVTILATIMTFVMTFFVTYSNLGFVNNFVIKWMIAWGTCNCCSCASIFANLSNCSENIK